MEVREAASIGLEVKTIVAQAAHAAGDKEASRAIHEQTLAAPEVHAGAGSDFIKSLVFGGLDGIITTFSTIASVAGSSLPLSAVLVLGFANLIADGIAMGTGDFMSSKAEFDSQVEELAATEARFAANPAAMQAASVRDLVSKGFSQADAEELTGILATQKDFFVKYHMGEQAGRELPGDDPLAPLKDGTVTFVSFLVFGSIPMWVYVIAYGANYKSAGGSLAISAAATVLALAALGYLQGQITKQSRGRAALLMTLNGSLACAAAYLLSWGIMAIIGNGESGCM